jgi:hypothetical protein
MTFAEYVGQAYTNGTRFSSLEAARAAYAGSGACRHTSTCLGECTECGHVLNVEGTFKVNPDKSRYLDARRI